MRSIRNQIAWCYRAHWTLTLIMGVVIVVFFVGGWLPGNRRLSRLREEIQSKSRLLETSQSRAVNLPILTAKVAELDARLVRFNKRLPKNAELGEFIRDITQVSQQYNLRKLVHQPGQIRRQELYSEVPITMNFEGDFVSVFNFLRQMEEMQRLTRVKNISVRCRDPKLGHVDVSMAMNIYFSEL